MRRRGHALDRDHLGERRVGVDVAADEVEEVDLATGHQAPRDLHALGARQALVPVLVGHHADADDEVRPHPLPDGGEHAEGEAQPVVEAAAPRSEEHTSEVQSLMRISYAVFCLKTKTIYTVH